MGSPYRVSLPPHRPIRARRRRFHVRWLAPWQTLSHGMVIYLHVASWVVHAVILALIVRFEMPSGVICGGG